MPELEITPEEAAAVYLWAIGNGQRQPPEGEHDMRTVGSGLHKLVRLAGDRIAWEVISDEDLELGDDLTVEQEFALEQRVHEHAERTGPTIGGEPAVERIRAAMRVEVSGVGFRVAGKQVDPWVQPPPPRDAKKVRSAIAVVLNSLPFVRWDRCVMHPESIIAYGWIERDDGRADFVMLEFDGAGEFASWTTSSATYSQRIYDILIGGESHTECQRVSDVFGDAVERTVGP
jgi:hypothetical protein